MRLRSVYCAAFALIVLSTFAGDSYLSDAQAQQRRRRPSRRVTNPIPSRPAPDTNTAGETDVTIVSTAEETSAAEITRPTNVRTEGRARRSASTEAGQESLQRTVNRLSAQVTRLAAEMNQLKEQQVTLVDLERLTRAEQRAESLRGQLREVLKQESDLQARSEQLEYELQPESINQRASLTGSTRPEAVRETLQRQLQSERTRVRAQLDQLAESRVRLEAAIINADASAERIRARTEETVNKAERTNTATDDAETPVSPPATVPPSQVPQP